MGILNFKKYLSIFFVFFLASACFLPGLLAENPASLPVIEENQDSVDDLNPDVYAIHAGDKLNIQVYREKDLSGVFTVYPSGKINFPLLGEIYVDSLSLEELKKFLTDSLSGYLVNPQIQIEVEESPSKSIAVLGQVAHPGNYILTTNLNLVRLISQVGGFAPGAATGNIRIVRTLKNGKKRNIVVDVNLIMKGEREDVVLFPGDIVYVDQVEVKKDKEKSDLPKISLLGQVGRPGNYDFSKELTLVKLISEAGGFNNIAAPNRVKLIRKSKDPNNKKGVTTIINVRKILDGNADDIALEPDDLIVVPESYF